MANVEQVLNTLHPLERRVLSLTDKFTAFSDLIVNSGLKDVEVTRAVQWLKNKEILTISEIVRDVINLDNNGKKYMVDMLPERRFLNALKKEMDLKQVQKTADLSKEETDICLGILKRKSAIVISKDGKTLNLSLSDQGRALMQKEFLEETFLKKIFPIDLKSLKPEEKFALDELRKRKNILKIEKVKEKSIALTELGKQMLQELLKQGVDVNVIERVTHEILKNKQWKNKQFREYDVRAQVPKINYGKKHFENEVIDYVKKIFLEMGFIEMNGTLIQSAFWDMDALFTAQDHPVREMQDTFYLKNPKYAKLPKELVPKIKAVHENGGNTGSIGWQYKWNEEKAKELLLRTHTTVLSARTISRLKKEDLPLKFFSVGKVFRNEALDWKHLFELYQVEGIVVDENANFKHLKGYLKEFFTKMGYDKIRIKPAHFPYTEPSVEVEVYNPEKKEWIELGGAGIFRPEVVKPLLGIEIPVLAWGLGLGRIMVPYFNIHDIREINKNDLKQLREIKKWML